MKSPLIKIYYSCCNTTLLFIYHFLFLEESFKNVVIVDPDHSLDWCKHIVASLRRMAGERERTVNLAALR